MTKKFNPFVPHSPVYNDMFAGRMTEIEHIDNALYQAKKGNPTHIMLTGERGIGKTSLLLLAKFFANGEIIYDDASHNFLTVQVTLTNKMSIVDLAVSLKKNIKREIDKRDPDSALIKKCWNYFLKIEACGLAFRGDKSEETTFQKDQVVDEFIYALVDTVKNVTGDSLATDMGLKSPLDGLVVLIDEADNANADLDLGVFLKKVNETLVSERCNNVMFLLAGLPNLHEVLSKSHESSLRLFKNYNLDPLTRAEVTQVMKSGLSEYYDETGEKVTIDDDALRLIYLYSEGYPHFVQQIGHSIFENLKGNKIIETDVRKSFLGKNGALKLIGDRYYYKIFYIDIKTDVQRKILSIMAENWDEWVDRDFIKRRYKGKVATLDSGLKSLREKNIILSRKGKRGQYRLQWASFAFWIKKHKEMQ